MEGRGDINKICSNKNKKQLEKIEWKVMTTLLKSTETKGVGYFFMK